jgi:hypothetical protein
MNSAARKRRIEIPSASTFMSQGPPRRSSNPAPPHQTNNIPIPPKLQRQVATDVNNQSFRSNPPNANLESAKTSMANSAPSLFTLPEVIKVIGNRLISLENKNLANDENVILELSELRQNILKIEETLHATIKFVAESMHILFEKTGCKPTDSLGILGELIGIEVADDTASIIA